MRNFVRIVQCASLMTVPFVQKIKKDRDRATLRSAISQPRTLSVAITGTRSLIYHDAYTAHAVLVTATAFGTIDFRDLFPMLPFADLAYYFGYLA